MFYQRKDPKTGKKSGPLWLKFKVDGRLVRLSTGTANLKQAREFEATARAGAWRQTKLGERPPYAWSAARKRWLSETRKRTKAKDEAILAWFDEHLAASNVQDITRPVIEKLRELRAEESSQATADRFMALLRAILRKCVHDWEVLDVAPKVPMFRPKTAEPRWLSPAEFARLRKELPEHLALAAEFAVLTGLRMRSMLSLTWSRIDMKKRRAWIPGEQMKAGKTLGIRLPTDAIPVLKKLRKLAPDGDYVFQWRGEPIDDCNTKAFQDAVKAAGLEGVNWHTLRHTFASWAVQKGVSLHELMQLGGWSSYSMVLRYSHLAPDHLAAAADKLRLPKPSRRSAQHAAHA